MNSINFWKLQKQKKTLFEPFVTAKEKGLGLGLAIASKIVKMHNGRIEVSSKKDQGAQFRVYIPREDHRNGV